MKQITLGTYPLYYGENNLTDAFTKKQIGFELEIKTDNSIHREILSFDELTILKEKIDKSLKAYAEFHQAKALT